MYPRTHGVETHPVLELGRVIDLYATLGMAHLTPLRQKLLRPSQHTRARSPAPGIERRFEDLLRVNAPTPPAFPHHGRQRR